MAPIVSSGKCIQVASLSFHELSQPLSLTRLSLITEKDNHTPSEFRCLSSAELRQSYLAVMPFFLFSCPCLLGRVIPKVRLLVLIGATVNHLSLVIKLASAGLSIMFSSQPCCLVISKRAMYPFGISTDVFLCFFH